MRRTAAAPRFGVEEEFLVVDAATREVVPRAGDLVEAARRRLGDRVGGEITKLQVESRTTPCATAAELADQLAEGRAVLAEVAGPLGLAIVASGTPVCGPHVPPPVTEGPRQTRGTRTFRGLHDELSICATHVHVQVPDRDRAVRIGTHLRPVLPVLVGLAANSPFWDQRDTGYASWRTVTWSRWPVAGPPPPFTCAADYDAHVAALVAAGALVDTGTIFWDVRPSAAHPTVEVRAADVLPGAAESAAYAALVRALVVAAGDAVDAGRPVAEPPAETLRVAYWRAARDGMGGEGIDVHTGELTPARELARRLRDGVADLLAEHGDLDRVDAWLSALAAHGDGAARQRAAHAGGDLTSVVDALIAGTAPVPAGSA